MNGKKVWVEILTPKQVMFFGRLVKKLREKGFETFVTSRDYREVNKVIENNGIKADVVGRHGGASLSGKLSASIDRTQKLQKIAESEKPDLAVYLSSPEAARVSFGLGIPSICFSDIPEAEAQSRLAVPISTKIVCPACVPKSEFVKFGAAEENIIQYNGLDPVVWIRDFEPSEKILDELGIDRKNQLVTFRTEETQAAYLKNKSKNSMLVPVIKKLSEKTDANIVVLSRYGQADQRGKEMSGAVVIDYVSDPQSLMYYSDVFVGAGGTMSIEAALLGTPTLSCRRIETHYEKFAEESGLIERAAPGSETDKIIDMLEKNGEYKERLREVAGKLVAGMEDPVEVIVKTAEDLLK